jgi:hypothetical protein
MFVEKMNCNRSYLVLAITQVQVCLVLEKYAYNNQPCTNRDSSTTVLEVTCYKIVEARKVRNPSLTIDYTDIYVYNYSISSARRFYGLSNNELHFIVVALSPCAISYAFTSRSSWSLKCFIILLLQTTMIQFDTVDHMLYR